MITVPTDGGLLGEFRLHSFELVDIQPVNYHEFFFSMEIIRGDRFGIRICRSTIFVVALTTTRRLLSMQSSLTTCLLLGDECNTRLLSSHRGRQRSTGSHRSRYICRSIPSATTPGRHGYYVVSFVKVRLLTCL